MMLYQKNLLHVVDEILELNINDDSGFCMFPHSENHELVSNIIDKHCVWPEALTE